MLTTRLIHKIVPPIFTDLYRFFHNDFRRCHSDGYNGVYNNFKEINITEDTWSTSYISRAEDKVKSIRKLNEIGYFVPRNFGGQSENASLALLLVNLILKEKACRVLDFGGSYGILYYWIKNGLMNPQDVEWIVIDNNQANSVG